MAQQPGQAFETMTLADVQAFRKAMPKGFELGGPPEPMARVEDRKIPTAEGDVPARVYWPSTEARLPVVFYFHGGGWVFGTPDWTDTTCRSLSNVSGCVFVSVDYRCAPEHKYPAAVEDCYAVVDYVTKHPAEFGVDASRVGVCGDSAGGNLAAVVCQMARDRMGPKIDYQVLVYPCVDYLDESPSMTTYGGEGYFLSEPTMKWFWNQYADESLAKEPYLSPIHAETLAALPPALVVLAECDPLVDQGKKYAIALSAAGVPAVAKEYEGMIHAFLHMGAVIDAGKTVIKDIGKAIGKALHAPLAAHT
jgi:acetyl esterase